VVAQGAEEHRDRAGLVADGRRCELLGAQPGQVGLDDRPGELLDEVGGLAGRGEPGGQPPERLEVIARRDD
jgi:hypothetical protein